MWKDITRTAQETWNIGEPIEASKLSEIGADNKEIIDYINNELTEIPVGRQIRYIRDSSDWSTANTANFWTEIQAYRTSDGANAALNKTVTSNWNVTNIARVTDWDLTGSQYYSSGYGPRWVQVDLGAVFDIEDIRIWRYFVDGRTFHDVKTEVSLDGEHWFTIFDSKYEGEYAETSAGRNFFVKASLTPFDVISTPNNNAKNLATNYDLDTLYDTGIYDCNTATNKPSGSSSWGYVFVISHSNTANPLYAEQVYYELNTWNNRAWRRNSVAGTWSDWKEEMNSWNVWEYAITRPIQLFSADDLNDITEAGMYYTPSSATATSIGNTPGNYAFSLLVEKHAGTKQTFSAYYTSGARTYVRNKYSNSWGVWREVIDNFSNQELWGLKKFTNRLGIWLDAVSQLHVYQDQDGSGGSSTGVTIENAGTGDALLQFLLTGVRRWVMWIDNSYGDRFRLSTGVQGFGWNIALEIEPTTYTVHTPNLTKANITNDKCLVTREYFRASDVIQTTRSWGSAGAVTLSHNLGRVPKSWSLVGFSVWSSKYSSVWFYSNENNENHWTEMYSSIWNIADKSVCLWRASGWVFEWMLAEITAATSTTVTLTWSYVSGAGWADCEVTLLLT